MYKSTREPAYNLRRQENKQPNSKKNAKESIQQKDKQLEVAKKSQESHKAVIMAATPCAPHEPSSLTTGVDTGSMVYDGRADSDTTASMDMSGASEFLLADIDPATSGSPDASAAGRAANNASTDVASTSTGSEQVLSCIADLKKEMISMFTNNTHQLNSKLDFVIGELNGIKVDLSKTKQAVSDLEENVNLTDNRIREIVSKDIPTLDEKIKKQKDEMEEKLTLIEIHQRKQNLLVYGVPDKAKEDIIATTRDILSHFLQVPPDAAARIPLINAHRLPGAAQRGKQLAGQESEPCPIIIRFASMFDRDRVLQAYEFQQRERRDNPMYARVSIRTDLPAKLKRERGRLAAIAYRLRRDEKVSTRIKLSGQNVILQTRKSGRDGSPSTAWTTYAD